MPSMTVTSADGTMLAVRRTGGGSPLVLVHGALGDLDTFALIEGLLAERHSVWVYSRRGRGGSGDGRDYAFEREIEDVSAIVDAAGGDAHLVGHSFGALCCLFAATRSPSLRSLVLYEPPLRSDRFDPSVAADAESALDAGDPDRALAILFPALGIVDQEAQILRTLQPVWARLREGVRLCPREGRALQDGHRQLIAHDPPDIPTLYLYGQETNAPSFAELDEVAGLLPNARLHGLPGQRHLAFAFDPATFAETILAFTTTHDAASVDSQPRRRIDAGDPDDQSSRVGERS